MDPILLLVALACGLVAQQLRLPPLVGFLIAGFVLQAMGQTSGELLELAADLGVLLLLFLIGLKLNLRSLLVPAIWGGASLHMMLSVALTAPLFIFCGLAGLTTFTSLDWGSAATVAFALSFSSTVFAVKILEERGETRTRHGSIAIGILIIQDIIAVAFLLFAHGKVPSLWALILLALPLLRPVLTKLMIFAGHGELLVLFGLSVAFAGAELFELLGMKADLGALVFGVLLSGHLKSVELSKALMGFKDFFLVGFFLSIGLMGLPNLEDVVAVVLLVAMLLPLKMATFFLLLTRFRVRARSAFLSMLGLASFSEFGLIVSVEGASVGWISEEWLVIVAIAVAVSFVLASLLNARAHLLYARYERSLCRFQTEECLPGDEPADVRDADVLVVGMGRVGRGAYQAMTNNYDRVVCGVDVQQSKIKRLVREGYNIIAGDAEDIDFWRHAVSGRLKLVMLALPTHKDMLLAAELLQTVGFEGRIGAVTKFEDNRIELEQAGVHSAFNYYTEVGVGFADHVQRELS
jgi:glutathione-regulated potassium-efflux system ancillary protein KefC